MTSERGSQRRRGRRDSIVVRYDGQEYVRDLIRCRRAVLQGKGERRFGNIRELARLVGLSQATASKFLSGAQPCSKETTGRLLAGLGLTFDEVHQRVDRPREGERALTAT